MYKRQEYIPAPEADVDAPFQMLVSAIDYNEYVGRMAIGRIERGTLKQNQEIMVCNYHNPYAAPKKAKAVSLYEFDGLGKKPVTESKMCIRDSYKTSSGCVRASDFRTLIAAWSSV